MASKKPKGSNSSNGFDQFKGSMIPTIVRPDQYTNYERAREYVEEHNAGLSCLQRHILDTSVPLRERFLAAFDESKDAVAVFPTLIAASAIASGNSTLLACCFQVSKRSSVFPAEWIKAFPARLAHPIESCFSAPPYPPIGCPLKCARTSIES